MTDKSTITANVGKWTMMPAGHGWWIRKENEEGQSPSYVAVAFWLVRWEERNGDPANDLLVKRAVSMEGDGFTAEQLYQSPGEVFYLPNFQPMPALAGPAVPYSGAAQFSPSQSMPASLQAFKGQGHHPGDASSDQG